MDKNKIINEYSKGEFSSFLEHDNNGQVLQLFDAEGIEILKNSSLKSDRIRYILTFSKYKEELLKNDNFLDVLFTCDVSDFYAVLSSLSFDISDKMFKKYINIENDSYMVAKFFNYFSLDFKLKILDDFKYSQGLLCNIINLSNDTSIIQKVLDRYNIDLSDDRLNLSNLFEKSKSSFGESITAMNEVGKVVPSISIPSSLITKKVAKRIWDSNDIFAARGIINTAQFSADVSTLNDYFKEQEDQIISGCNEDNLVSPYSEIRKALYGLSVASGSDEYRTSFLEFRKMLRGIKAKDEFGEIYEKFNLEGFDRTFKYLKILSDRMISNYIIDYHFEENFHNIMLDMREMLRFYYDGNMVIQDERVQLYEKIANIDYLSLDEKKELHEMLKKVNIMEMFYDDMSMARHIVNEAIKEYSLTSESLQQYRDEKLSSELGVDVFNVNDEPFFGIVKTGRHPEDTLPTGHSYSLVGRGGVAVYGDEKASSTFLYDAEELNPDQIVHTYPFDSFTFFRPFRLNETQASSKVNTLLMPEELVGISPSYNEILILEQGTKQTDIDKDIPKLKQIALYCVDNISKKDVEVAKDKGVGIILVSSKKYLDEREQYEKNFLGNDDEYRYGYFNGTFERDQFEAKR